MQRDLQKREAFTFKSQPLSLNLSPLKSTSSSTSISILRFLYTKHQLLVLITISLKAFPRPILPKEKEKPYFQKMEEIKTRDRHSNGRWRRGYLLRHQVRVSCPWKGMMSSKEYYKNIKREKGRDEEK